ncbi:calcium/sodium antiporter [Ketobacter sp. MCCC 1A13808]|uniref:calcium/sodium antiporter n=1 Tax=Ketobacter sp. MCCC 1A13808 TaxID=2602738 RepID=UPI000F177B1E|nr:calcium/sodium antiporter [Ketobacter sp. MCCC 1A13808]MVF11242.1 calcium/sodium antiporter [Ketobacter sp. MCCC 1A13808]RLP53627.1 MAG: calcium/sodium antiporter [Ketobacter sp.]
MLVALLAIVAGLILLVWSSDKFVDGAVGLASALGMSKAMIGLTIVALGTSAPEIVVSIMSALSGAPELALGNAIGSNIANIGLVLGVTAIIAALPIQSGLLKEDLPALIAVTAGVGFLCSDNQLTQTDAFVMIVMLILLMYLLFRYKSEHQDELIEQTTQDDIQGPSKGKSTFWFIVGTVVLIGSSRLLVWGAIEIARAMQISEVIIGLTIVAIGTSLPELAASIASALRKHHDIALGNIVGSNILNLLAVLSAAAVIHPIEISSTTLIRDYGVMCGVTLLLALFMFLPRKARQLSRIKGGILLAAYLAYLAILYQQTITASA